MGPNLKLKLLRREEYKAININDEDPIHYYYWPILGKMYQRRVELCLAECRGGERILEIGYGNGLTFLNLNEMYAEIHGLDLKTNAAEITSIFQKHGIRTFLKQGTVFQLPYQEGYFDSVLLISILEHLKPNELKKAFQEIRRVLKPGGQMIYGVPVERPFMVAMFRLLGHDIRQSHFSTEEQIAMAANELFREEKIVEMKSIPPVFGIVYEVGHFVKD
jgi:ubiquinone/menaquinone biosynthesis C-methylase UbiE